MLLIYSSNIFAQNIGNDNLPSITKNNFILSDSAILKLKSKKLTRLIYESIVSTPKPQSNADDKNDARLKQYKELLKYEGKTISNIHINRLDVFGPTFDDTTKFYNNAFAQIANEIHTKSSYRAINRSLFIKEGESLSSEKILENERILRQLPSIKDAKIIVIPNQVDTTMVRIIVLTKDVFSYGADISSGNINNNSIEIYNTNIFKFGHRAGVELAWGNNDGGWFGTKVNYSINNIYGTLSDINFGYTNTYYQQGFTIGANKPFVRTDSKFGGGVNYYRFYKAFDYIEPTYDIINNSPLSYSAFDIWGGHSINEVTKNEFDQLQVILLGRYRYVNFLKRPEAGEGNKQYFSNSKLYLLSLNLSKRLYIRDNRVYGYGVTEDIPKGFLHDLTFGYDDNEFMKRFYSHIFFSSGNIIKFSPSYMYLSAGFGTFFNKMKMEQGKIEIKWNYISKLFYWNQNSIRQFFSVNYIYGLNRFEQESIKLNNDIGIRGFESQLAKGKQRLAISSETVNFLPKKVWGFSIALFDFIDIGMLADDRETIFKGNFYFGFGGGIRMRNENLIFNTLQLRLGFYPIAPSDQKLFNGSFKSRGQSNFYDFQVRKPAPLEYH